MDWRCKVNTALSHSRKVNIEDWLHNSTTDIPVKGYALKNHRLWWKKNQKMNFMIVRLFGQTSLKKIQMVSPAILHYSSTSASTTTTTTGRNNGRYNYGKKAKASLTLGAAALVLGGISSSSEPEDEKGSKSKSVELIGIR